VPLCGWSPRPANASRWTGHFGTLSYAGDQRKLYAFALVDGHSRMSYLEFTHSQCFETFIRCHIHAFAAFNGVSRYVRQNFWPLREFTDLHDVNRHARQWLTEVANQRLHHETRERPIDRFRADALRPLPVIPYDYRDTVEALVHKDLRLQFDGNRYCVPHRFVGRRLTVKADSNSVTIYHRYQEIVSYAHSWRRGQTLGAERFERELSEQRPAARRSQHQRRFLDFLDGLCAADVAEGYLRGMADSDRVLSRQLNEPLELIRQYGADAVAGV